MALLLLLLAAAAGAERPECAAAAAERCQQGDVSTDEYFYKINGRSQILNFVEGDYYKTTCGAALDDPAQPRFPRPFLFRKVVLRGCAPPAAGAGAYADALRALGLRADAVERLELQLLPAAPPPAALRGLPRLAELRLEAAAPAALPPDALDALPALRRLALERLRPARLPPRLRYLRLRAAGLRALPPLPPELEEAHVDDDALTAADALGAAVALRSLALTAPLPALPPLPPALAAAALSGLAVRELAAWPACARLENLTLAYGALETLRAGWLRGCGRLRALTLSVQPRLRALPARAFAGAEALEALSVTSTALEALPADVFAGSPRLRAVDLSRNRLLALAGGTFAPLARSLRALELSRNRLPARALAALAPLTSLESLSLARNPLGALCGAHAAATSALGALRRLRALSLSRVGARWPCADWLRDMTLLETLDLTYNNITEITLTDLVLVRRSQRSTLDLTRNPLRLTGARDEYQRAAAAGAEAGAPLASVLLPPLACDCGAYWPRRALAAGRVPARVQAVCAPGTPRAAAADLADVDPAELRCALPAPGCPAACACALVPHLGGLEYECEAPPPAAHAPPAPLVLRHLRLAGAGLRALPRLPHLLGNLTLLDLRDNNITGAEEAEAGARLLAGEARLLLAGNPLTCGCGPTDLLAALRPRARRLLDATRATCADGRALAAALEGGACAGAGGAWAALGALALLAAGAGGAGAALLRRHRARLRHRAKEWLRARGWMRPARPELARPFDAFVSHAAADEAWVLRELAPRLEARGVRLCVRARDWPPGAWLPAAVDASLAASARALLVLSARRAGDAWAAHELRAACALAAREGRARVVLLRLDASPPPPELRAAAHAVAADLRAQHPRFWRRLLAALPAPRAPHPAPTPPPPPHLAFLHDHSLKLVAEQTGAAKEAYSFVEP